MKPDEIDTPISRRFTYTQIPIQYWFKELVDGVIQQAITWGNVDYDLRGHMVPLGHNIKVPHWHFGWLANRSN